MKSGDVGDGGGGAFRVVDIGDTYMHVCLTKNCRLTQMDSLLNRMAYSVPFLPILTVM